MAVDVSLVVSEGPAIALARAVHAGAVVGGKVVVAGGVRGMKRRR